MGKDNEMTRDEIPKMKAGREMDALVAERVIGWVWTNISEEPMLIPPLDDKRMSWAAEWDEEGRPHWLPEYSTDISAAWEVVEKFVDVDIEKAGLNYHCTIEAQIATAPSAPLAICRAALLATLVV